MEVICHQTGKDPMYRVWHTSDENLIICFHSSGGSIVCSDGNFPIKEGALAFIGAGTYHYTIPDSPESYDRSKLFISKEEWEHICELLGEKKQSFSKAVLYAEPAQTEQKRACKIFESLSSCRQSEKRLAMLACTFELLGYLDRYSKASMPSVSGLMATAVNYINKNISLDIDIDNVCSAVNISKYYFCRQFKKHTGMTVMQYILNTRIVLAKNDLKKTSLSVTEISEKYGFSSVSYFSRIFKEKEGSSPLSYRKSGE